MKYKLSFSLLILIVSNLFATTHTIKQDGSGDFMQIQAGIDFATAGDTIRVYPGTYQENLSIDKDLSLISNYFYSNDADDIQNTIIDGNQNGTCLDLQGSEENPINNFICGFRIENGKSGNAAKGGGITLNYSATTLADNHVTKNLARSGGGLFAKNSSLNLSGCIISNNSSYLFGGGLCMLDTSCTFDENILNSIFLNYAGKGNDIYRNEIAEPLHVVVDTFTVDNPDFYFLSQGDYPGGYYVENGLSYDIQNAKIEQVEADLYVAVDGDDNNSGLNPSEPLQTISYALTLIKADQDNHRNIFLADGIYKPSEGQHFPLHLKSYVNIIGESRENTILDGEGEIQYFIYNWDKLGMFEPETYDQYLCKKFSVKNLSFDNVVENSTISTNESAYHTFENIDIKNAVLPYGQVIWSLLSRNATYKNITLANNQGSGISMQTGLGTHHLANIVLKDNLPITDEEGLSGGAFISVSNPNGYNPDVTVNIFNYQSTDNFSTNNEVVYHGSSLSLYFNAKVNLINSTLANNLIYVCGAIGMANGSELNIYNSIIHNNSPRQILLDGTNNPNTLRVYNSLVEGGPSEAASYGANNMYWNAESNLYESDPLFQGEDSPFPYALNADSPCIDAGTTDLPDGLQLPATDLAGNQRISGETVDMGAYEFTPQAAPYNLQIDAENGTIFWQAPFYDFPDSYNIYLDGAWYDNLTAQILQYQYQNLEIGEEYLAGVSAQYGSVESDIAEISFLYNPVYSEEDLSPLVTNITNYPNPFGSSSNKRAASTNIKFQLAESGQVDLAIYNAKGQKVCSLMQAKCSRGIFQMQWDGTNDSGKTVASGTYLIKLKVDDELQQAHKITLLK